MTDKQLLSDIQAAQQKFDAEAEKARDARFRLQFQSIMANCSDPEATSKAINQLLKDYNSLSDHRKV